MPKYVEIRVFYVKEIIQYSMICIKMIVGDDGIV